jgi:hypothetical protein
MSGSQKKQQNKQTQAKASAPKTTAQPEQSVNLEQLVSAPETMRSEEMIAAQRQVGNQVVQRALDAGKKKRDAMTDEQGYLTGEINDAIQKKRGGGSPLPDSLREDASKRLKHDFGDVRIHTDEQSNELSQSINARAFTIGKDIFFKKGVFSPGSKAGRETLMHELTHVVQQSGGSSGGSGRLKLGGPDTAHEKQADKVGKANSGITAANPSAVQREPDDREEQLKRQHLNAEIEAFNPNRLKAPAQEQAPDDDAPIRGRAQAAADPAARRGHAPDDDAVQLQRDAVIQREEMPEDELQMQRDTVVQRVVEEDELQMQRDTTVQREEMPEDELQMQRDTGVVQRIPFDPEFEEGAKAFQKRADERSKIKKVTQDDSHGTNEMQKKQSLMQDIKGFDKSQLKKVDPKDIKDASAPNPRMTKEEKHDLSKKVSRRDLMETLKDPSKSPEDIQKAQSMLKDLHGGKSKEFKKAGKERTASLKSAAEKGDQASYDKWKNEKGASAGQSFLGGAKKAGGFLGGFAKRFAGKAVDDMSEQLFGKKEEEKKEAAPIQVNVAGGGGGGGGGGFEMLEKYITENQKLKAENEELKAKAGK